MEILNIAASIYVITGLISLRIAYKFYLSQDGRLREALVELFTGIGVAVVLRGIWGFLELTKRVELNPIVSIISILLVLVTMLRFYIALKNIHKKK